MKNENIPKSFWKYYDLYRRKRISLEKFQSLTGIDIITLSNYIKTIKDETKDDFLIPICYNEHG